MEIYKTIEEFNKPKLDKEYYIYVLKNNNNAIKIGISQDINTRVKSLSNSNAGGSFITDIAISQPTYLKTIEGILHSKFKNYRVPNSEWFINLDFNIVIEYVDELFNSKSYDTCNNLRKQYGYKGRSVY